MVGPEAPAAVLTSHVAKSPGRRWQQRTPPSPFFLQDGNDHYNTAQESSHRLAERRSAWEQSVARDLGEVTFSIGETARSLEELRTELQSQGQLSAAHNAFAVAVEALKSYITAINDRLESKIEWMLQDMNQHLTERLENITEHCIRIKEDEQRSLEFLESHKASGLNSSYPNALAPIRPSATVGGDPLTEFSNSKSLDEFKERAGPTPRQKTQNTIQAFTNAGEQDRCQQTISRGAQKQLMRIQSRMATPDGMLSDNDVERCWSYLYVVSFWLIVAYVIWVGVSFIVILPSARRGERPPGWLFYGDCAFLVVFLIELLMRLALERRRFFTGPWAGWNAFDTVITVCQLLSLLGLVPRIDKWRVIKSFRIMRTARIIRANGGLREARLIVQMEWKPCLWGFCLMFALSYIFAVAVSDSVSDWLYDGDGLDHPLRKTVERYYGTFPGTMYTILLASAHGASWSEIREPLESINWWLPPIFLAYIMVMNLIALFVDAVTHVGNLDRTLEASDTALQVAKLIDGQLKPLFEQAERIRDGRISRDAMLKVLGRKDGASVLNDLNLDLASMKALYKLVDAEERGSVLIDDFCAAFVHLKGSGSSVHTAMLLFQSRRILVRLDRLGRTTESRLHTLKGLVQSSRSSKASSSGYNRA